MARKKTIDLAKIENEIYLQFQLVEKIAENPINKKPTKAIKSLFLSIRKYRINARDGSIEAYKVFKINGYDAVFQPLAELVKNRLRAYSGWPIEKLTRA